MVTLISDLQPIVVTPGVQPVTDRTALSTPHYTAADKIRFWRNTPQKIGGWRSLPFQAGATILGKAYSLYSAVIANAVATVIGTHQKLYGLAGQVLTNITPLSSTANAIANSITTDYATLSANPISVTNGSNVVTVTDSNAPSYAVNDTITLAGAVDTGGIVAASLNASHIIRSISGSTYTFRVGGNASSSVSGGGASVIRSSGLLTFSASAHGQANGDRVKISGAVDSGGVLANNINKEWIIRGVTTNSFSAMTAGMATSHVTGAGGAATAYQKEIAPGAADESFGQGYGLGLYGAGLYGVSKASSGGRQYPRIWFSDRFADRVITTPGNQGGIYIWDGSVGTAPVAVSNAPTDVNYAFVSDNVLVTFGHQNVPNQIFASDQGDPTIWTASSQNQVFQDVVVGAGRLLSHVPVASGNLLFTESQTYRFQYIGLPLVWSIELLDNAIGIIAPMARCAVNGIAYWMGQDNFYRCSGGPVQVIPSNTQAQSTLLNYVFSNINTAQKSKCFAWYNALYHEVWFHYPSMASNNCDRIARVSLIDFSWVPDTLDRVCAEYPANLLNNPRLIDSSGSFYIHEYGSDADGAALPFLLTSNLRTHGKNTTVLSGLVPDSVQQGSITVRIDSFAFPQSAGPIVSNSYTVTPDTEKIAMQVNARFWKYTWHGEDLDQPWIMGSWMEYVQRGSEE